MFHQSIITILKGTLSLLFCLGFLMGKAQQTEEIVDSLEKELKSAKHDTIRIKILDNLSNNCEVEDIIKYAEPQVKLAEQKLINQTKGNQLHVFYSKYLSDGLCNIGYFFKQKGEILEALNAYEKALIIKKEITDKAGMALVLNNIAMIYHNQGRVSKALEYNSRSLRISEEINDKGGIANSLNNIGGIYDEQGDFEKALDHYRKCLKLREDLNDTRGIATTLSNMGFIYLSLGDTLAALNNCNKMLSIHEKNKNQGGVAYALNNLGFIYLNQGKLDTAFTLYSNSLKIREEIGDKQGLAYSYNNIASIYSKQKKYDKAIELSILSLTLSRELGFPVIMREAALSLKNAYQKTNQPAKAIEMYELYIQMRDSVSNTETKKAALKTQLKYDFDKKEAILVEQQNQERVLANEKAQKQKIIIWSGFIGLLIVVLFLVFVFNRLQITRRQKKIIQEQKYVVELHQKEITDSINYAKRIQYALLASEDLLNSHLPEHFVLFKPKDIVSGDFYWGTPVEDGFILVTADCTGHGVPGAFMSLLNISKLNQIVNEKKIIRPDIILNHVREEIIHALNPPGSTEISKDGMDAVVCKLNLKKRSLQFASANNSFYLIRNNTLLTCKADKMPVGKGHDDSIAFTFNEIKLQKGDLLYIFTDGLADQFGGPAGKKFKYKQLENLLLNFHQEQMTVQKQEIDSAFEKWKGNLEQVDDVCLIGIKINS